MDREGAETYLRLLAEAAMRGSLTPAAGPRAPNASTIMAAGHALTTVGALDPVTAEEILTDFRLATTARQLHHQSGGQGVTAAEWLTQGQAVLRPRQGPARAPREPAPWEDPDHGPADCARADRFVPVGLTVPFRAGAVRGELCLMSFAQTGSGARVIAAGEGQFPPPWGATGPH